MINENIQTLGAHSICAYKEEISWKQLRKHLNFPSILNFLYEKNVISIEIDKILLLHALFMLSFTSPPKTKYLF